MKQLNIASLFDEKVIGPALAGASKDPAALMTLLLGSDLFMLVAAFVFMSGAVMFIIRYIVLYF